MKKFTIALCIISITLIAGSVQSISAEQNFPIEGIFRSPGVVELIPSTDTNYQIYLQLVMRNADDQLINITESTAYGSYIPHAITDYVFDTIMAEKEVIAIDGVKWEKAQWEYSPSLEHRFMGLYPIYEEIRIKLTSTPNEDTMKMYNSKKDYSAWKMHYCATFGTDYNCLPIFQVLTPTITLEPTDTVTQKWTILKILD